MIARQNQIIHNDMIHYNTQIIYSFCCLIVLLDYSSLAWKLNYSLFYLFTILLDVDKLNVLIVV